MAAQALSPRIDLTVPALPVLGERRSEKWSLYDAGVPSATIAEMDYPLALPGATHTPWLEVSAAARDCGIALTSASKAFNLAGLKAALIVTAGSRARDLVAGMPTTYEHAGLLGVLAAEAAFDHGDAWLDAIIDQLDQNRTLLGDALSHELPQISWTPPQATFLAWLDCTALGLGDEPARTFLRDGRVALARGLNYGPQGAGHVRLNFATSPEHLKDAVSRMATAVRPAASA